MSPDSLLIFHPKAMLIRANSITVSFHTHSNVCVFMFILLYFVYVYFTSGSFLWDCIGEEHQSKTPESENAKQQPSNHLQNP